ncbi:hypothetical protein FN846DRAFT_960349 [Sphaerosporella brunnea]|uniref:Uncharacterized protein n=1 Tax=Sphaerosporella brunnea TaxID=1250544 RepID=A0A5J5EQJ0_9PEZI|nr:hypothetical protein FN846DRAFT_960349 [Sphaerosporella brunnea]
MNPLWEHEGDLSLPAPRCRLQGAAAQSRSMRLIAMANQSRSHQSPPNRACPWGVRPGSSANAAGTRSSAGNRRATESDLLSPPVNPATSTAPAATATLVQTSVPGRKCSRYMNPKGVHPEPRPGRKVCDQCLAKDKGYKRKQPDAAMGEPLRHPRCPRGQATLPRRVSFPQRPVHALVEAPRAAAAPPTPLRLLQCQIGLAYAAKCNTNALFQVLFCVPVLRRLLQAERRASDLGAQRPGRSGCGA